MEGLSRPPSPSPIGTRKAGGTHLLECFLVESKVFMTFILVLAPRVQSDIV